MPGKNYIKVTSILMLISAIIAVIVYPIAGLLLGYATVDTHENMGWLIVVICILYTIASVLQLIASVKGIKGCNIKEAADDLRKWGMVVLIIAVIVGVLNCISTIMQSGNIVTGIVSILVSMILPVLYIYGTTLNKRS